MKTIIENKYNIDLSKPIDISIPLSNTPHNPIAWYIQQPIIEPVVLDNWVGSVKQGASTNFNNITFNPHGHGTHTECLGHITRHFYSINQCLTQFFFKAQLISITPQANNNDWVITKDQIEKILATETPEALIIRTLPNHEDKKSKKYSHTNPPYVTPEAAMYICNKGIKHLLIDLPSVDKENDEGKLLAHKAFWNVTNIDNINPDARLDSTITEMIYVPNQVLDNHYILNLQIASFENDASPSKPILYEIF